MKYAIVNNELLEISSVDRGKKGTCPICKEEVIAKRGDSNEYFAHKSNNGKDCELKMEAYLIKAKVIKEKKVYELDEKLYTNYLNNEVVDSIGFTEEQLEVINSTENRVMVNSISGSGKTATMEEYIRRHPKEKILYLVFNSSMAKEARERFSDSDNAEIRTIHSYAYQYFGRAYKNFLTNNLNIFDIAKGIGKFIKYPEEFEYVEDLQDHFESYLLSKFHNIKDYCKFYKLDNTYNLHLNKLFQNSKNKKMNITHSFYYKLWHLSDPQFNGFDTLLIDEVNDINHALVDIVERNTSLKKIILTGDERQSLYKFAKCVNAFELLDKKIWKEYKLTNSFRIGNTLAHIIKASFSEMYDNFNIVGMNKKQNIVREVNKDKPYYMLCRYNATIIQNVIENAMEGKRIYIEGGKAGISFSFIKHLYEFKYHNKKHYTLKKFDDFEHLITYTEKVDDYEYKFALGLLNDYKEDLLSHIRSAEENLVDDWTKAEICYSSGHKSKGKSITIPLVISRDFKSLIDLRTDSRYSEEDLTTEKNLIYVCCTRAKTDIEIPNQLKELYLEIENNNKNINDTFDRVINREIKELKNII